MPTNTIEPAQPKGSAFKHCTVCGNPGGSEWGVALRQAGYAIPPGEAYAHDVCMGRAAERWRIARRGVRSAKAGK